MTQVLIRADVSRPKMRTLSAGSSSAVMMPARMASSMS